MPRNTFLSGRGFLVRMMITEGERILEISLHCFKDNILACSGGSGLLCYCQGSCPDGRKNGTCEAALDAGCFASAEEVGFSLVPWSAYSPNQVLYLNIKPLGLWLGHGHSGCRTNVRVSSSGRSWPYDVSWRWVNCIIIIVILSLVIGLDSWWSFSWSAGLSHHATPTAIECCRKGDLCNQRLYPMYDLAK